MKFEQLYDEWPKLDISVALAFDALNAIGVIPQAYYIDIKPKNSPIIYESVGRFGRAFTTRGRTVKDREIDSEEVYQRLDRIRLEMYDPKVIKPGSIVFLEANDNYVAHSGDITSTIYKQLGVKAFVTDGNVRDITKHPIPVYCEGVNPIDALYYWALTEYGIPIRIKKVNIDPGDLIFVDGDGVIVIPQRFEEKGFVEKYFEVHEKEANVRSLIQRSSPELLQGRLKQIEASGGRW